MEEKKKVKNLDMTEGSVVKSILLFSVPLLIGNIFQQLYNTADSVIAGNFIGKQALAAIGSSNSLINLMIGLFLGIASGAGVVIAQYYGAKMEDKMQWAVHTSMAVSIWGGILLTVLGVALSPQILKLMGTPKEIMDQSIIYLRIFFLGSVFNVVYNMASGILRGVGDSKRPLYYLCITSAVNIILDLLFVIVFHMGVSGAALATILSQALSAVLVVGTLMRDKDIYTLHLNKIKIDRKMMSRILKIGVPSGVQSAIISFSNVVVQANINSFGANAVAGCSSYMKIDGFVVLPIMSFGMAAMTYTGQNIGAGKKDRVKSGAVKTLMIGGIYCLVMSVVMFCFGKDALTIFSRDAAVNANGYTMLRILVPFYLCISIAQVLGGVFRGAGKSLVTMIIMVGSMVVIRMIWVNLMVLVSPTLATVLWGYPVSWVFAMLGVLVYAWKGKWLTEQNLA